jgi:hypothetical protein
MSQRLVVDMVGDPLGGLLSESSFVPKPFAFGGERVCAALAFAAAELGYEVELRGPLHEPTFQRFREATAAAPRVGLPARAAEAEDFVVVPEGWSDSLSYLQRSLSPARHAIFVLAAPGLFGWPFAAGWTIPDPVTVPIDALARPEHFRGMASFGFELLTHSEGIVQAARSADVECHYVGVGEPWDPADRAEVRSVDALAVMSNRWAPLAGAVLDQLSGLAVDPVPTVDNDEMLRRMARARVLVWPSRIEGHATIPVEARAVGCVPVALSTNVFAAALDEAHGAVLVDTPEAIAPAVRALLADEARLSRLSELGAASARELTDWKAFVQRVRRWLEAPAASDPGRAARAAAGADVRAAIGSLRAEHQMRLEERLLQIEVARRDLTEAALTQERLRGEIDWLTRSRFARAAARARRLARRLRRVGPG